MNGLFLCWCLLLYRLLWYGILKVALLFCSFFKREGTSVISCLALYFVRYLVTVVPGSLAFQRRVLFCYIMSNNENYFVWCTPTVSVVKMAASDPFFFSACTLDFYIIFGLPEIQFALESLYTFWLARNSFPMSFLKHIQIWYF